MSFDRPPPAATPPSILLMRAIAARPAARFPFFEITTVAAKIGVNAAQAVVLIRSGIDAGFLRNDVNGILSLTERGRRWCAG